MFRLPLFFVCIVDLVFFSLAFFCLVFFFAYDLYGCFSFQVAPTVISAMQMGLVAPRHMQSLAIGLNLLLRVIVSLINLAQGALKFAIEIFQF